MSGFGWKDTSEMQRRALKLSSRAHPKLSEFFTKIMTPPAPKQEACGGNELEGTNLV